MSDLDRGERPDGGTQVQAPEPPSADVMARLLDRVEHIGRAVDRLERAAEQAPAFAGLAIDTLDDLCRRADAAGVDLDARLGRLARLAERLTDGGTLDLLEGLVDRAPELAARVRQLDGLSESLGMLVDIFDEWAGTLAAQGIDLETALRRGLHAALWLGQRVSEPELERLGILIRSDVLDPHALAVVGKTGRALATCHEGVCDAKAPERLGPVGLLRALRDPDLQRALAFVVQVGRCFGGHLGEPADIALDPATAGPIPDGRPTPEDPS